MITRYCGYCGGCGILEEQWKEEISAQHLWSKSHSSDPHLDKKKRRGGKALFVLKLCCGVWTLCWGSSVGLTTLQDIVLNLPDCTGHGSVI